MTTMGAMSVAELFVLLLVALIVLGALLRLWIWSRGRRDGAGKLSDEDTRLIQEVHRDLGGMEKRIEALEALLLDKAPPGQDQAARETRTEETS